MDFNEAKVVQVFQNFLWIIKHIWQAILARNAQVLTRSSCSMSNCLCQSLVSERNFKVRGPLVLFSSSNRDESVLFWRKTRLCPFTCTVINVQMNKVTFYHSQVLSLCMFPKRISPIAIIHKKSEHFTLLFVPLCIETRMAPSKRLFPYRERRQHRTDTPDDYSYIQMPGSCYRSKTSVNPPSHRDWD